MKKIGILIQNKSIENIDMSDVKNGNPGVGGSQYHLFLLNQVLNSMNLDSIIFVERNQVGVSNSICYDNFEELIEKIKVFKIEFLIVWPKSTTNYKNLFCVVFK